MLAIPTEEPVTEKPDSPRNGQEPADHALGRGTLKQAEPPFPNFGPSSQPARSPSTTRPSLERSRPAPEPPRAGFPFDNEAPPSSLSNLATPLMPGEYSESLAKARSDFLANAPQTRIALGELLRSFLNAKAESERLMRLRDLYRKVHFITSMAALADCPPVGQMASAFEALLFELMARPSFISASPLATANSSVDFLGQLLESAPELTFSVRLKARVLVVDDDRLSSRLFVSSLQEAHMQARTTDNPEVALDWASKEDFQLFLLDIEMPGMNGFDLCKQLRAMPKYENTPVVYVTSHNDFQSRSEGMLSGGNDLIAKPVLPPELAVKAVMHLLKNQLGL